MKGIIDTSSLLAISRHFLAIEEKDQLLQFLESQFRNGELLFLNSIHNETHYSQQGMVLETIPFLNDKVLIINDDSLLPPAPRKFSNMLDNNFCIPLQRKRLSDQEYARQKEEYLRSGDARMILYALNNISDDLAIITEESIYSNDGKLFKKLPAICNMLDISHLTVAQWLSLKGVKIQWKLPEQ